MANRYEFSIGAASIPADMVFAVDYGTATGSGDAAVRDTDKSVPFSGVGGGSGNAANIIVGSAAGLDWPSTNALLVRSTNTPVPGGGRWGILTNGGWSIPGSGQSIYWRGYVRVISGWTDNANDGVHPVHLETANVGSPWRWVIVNSTGSTYTFRFNFNSASNATNGFYQVTLNKGTTYRWEIKLTMSTASTGVYDIRVYSRNGAGVETLAFESADFLDVSATDPLSAEGAVTVSPTSDLDGFSSGINGWDVSGTWDAFYLGCYAIRTADWCGQYSSAEASF